MVLYLPIIWVRNLSSLSGAFALSMVIILIVTIVTSAYALQVIDAQGGEPGPGYEPMNHDLYWNAIGFSFYMFEGIGCLMPVLKETEKPEQYPKIVVSALVLLCAIFIAFSQLCYYAWGQGLN
jgi:amino acid transporter